MAEAEAQLNPMAVLAYLHVELGGVKRQIPAPVATFGLHTPSTHAAPLIHVYPATAFPTIENRPALRGKIVVVERGDCSFAAKAKSIQAAGAIGMILTNSSEELVRMGEAFEGEGAGIAIPVLMVGQAMGRSLRDGMQVVIQLKHEQKTLLQASVEAVKKTVEQTGEVVQAGVEVVKKSVEGYTKDPEIVHHVSSGALENIVKPKPCAMSAATASQPLTPLFAFVLYATNADEFHVQFAPLADFGLSRRRLYYRSRLVFASPLPAHPSLGNKSAFPGAIAFVERGGCTFPEKIERLQQSGAVAVLVANNDTVNPDAAFVMSVDQFAVDHITIPSVMLPYSISQQILAQPPESVGIVCLEGAAAGVLLANETSIYSLWSPPPSTCLPPLLAAARTASLSTLATLLESTSPNATDAFNVSALHHACIAGSVEAVELLLAAGAHVDALDLGSQTPLHYACMAPSVACVQVLVTAAAHTLAVNEGGSTPLHVACFAGSTECMEVLLTATATMDASGKYSFHGVNEVDKSGRTPLHVACRYGHGDCAMYLMAAGAEVNFVDHKGWTALHYVCDRLNSLPHDARADLHVVEQLLRYGARMMDSKSTADALILDRIRSNAIRREVEVLYLRQEVKTQRSLVSKWEHEWQRMQTAMAQTVHAAKMEAAAVTAHLEHTLKNEQLVVQHLQCQMTSVLQTLQQRTSHNHPMPIVPSLPSDHAACNDTERAQEAALARDLGRKCMRAKQYALAKTYFETSLQWYALPGVRRLLDQVDKLVAAPPCAVAPSTKSLVEKYQARLRAAGASADVIAAVQDEINKLEQVEASSTQCAMVHEWLEWLVSLPWNERLPCSLSLFQRVNQGLDDEKQAKRHAAASVIQRAVREHFSAQLFQRQWAATIIQARCRGWQHRRQLYGHHSAPENDLQDAKAAPPLPTATETEPASLSHSMDVQEEANQVDFACQVDPALGKRSTAVLHRGVHLEQAKSGKFFVLQWISDDNERHFVWTRWGGGHFKETMDKTTACALKGPYDVADDARAEFERIFKHKTHHAWGSNEYDAATSSWAFHLTTSQVA
ncbi:unnamed protein product [Aphanomyces euteiches]|nr:hypothetical protein AeRB84_000087 [Aphanomyces euteiches]